MALFGIWSRPDPQNTLDARTVTDKSFRLQQNPTYCGRWEEAELASGVGQAPRMVSMS
jgi:hypothetical protein